MFLVRIMLVLVLQGCAVGTLRLDMLTPTLAGSQQILPNPVQEFTASVLDLPAPNTIVRIRVTLVTSRPGLVTIERLRAGGRMTIFTTPNLAAGRHVFDLPELGACPLVARPECIDYRASHMAGDELVLHFTEQQGPTTVQYDVGPLSAAWLQSFPLMVH